MIAVYDLCVDDDEQVREIGSKLTQDILSSGKSKVDITFAPLVASQRLSEHLSSNFSRSSELSVEALRRFWGCDTTDMKIPKPLSPHLEISVAKNDAQALFEEEKQNLFIDPARETVIWARVLKRLPGNALPSPLRRQLGAWVVEGLGALIESSDPGTKDILGLASQPDIFALGVRVLYGAEVLLTWLKHHKRAQMAIQTLLIQLKKFSDGLVIDQSRMWSDIATRILHEYSIGRFKALYSGTASLVASIGMLS